MSVTGERGSERTRPRLARPYPDAVRRRIREPAQARVADVRHGRLAPALVLQDHLVAAAGDAQRHVVRRPHRRQHARARGREAAASHSQAAAKRRFEVGVERRHAAGVADVVLRDALAAELGARRNGRRHGRAAAAAKAGRVAQVPPQDGLGHAHRLVRRREVVGVLVAVPDVAAQHDRVLGAARAVGRRAGRPGRVQPLLGFVVDVRHVGVVHDQGALEIKELAHAHLAVRVEDDAQRALGVLLERHALRDEVAKAPVRPVQVRLRVVQIDHHNGHGVGVAQRRQLPAVVARVGPAGHPEQRGAGDRRHHAVVGVAVGARLGRRHAHPLRLVPQPRHRLARPDRHIGPAAQAARQRVRQRPEALREPKLRPPGAAHHQHGQPVKGAGLARQAVVCVAFVARRAPLLFGRRQPRLVAVAQTQHDVVQQLQVALHNQLHLALGRAVLLCEAQRLCRQRREPGNAAAQARVLAREVVVVLGLGPPHARRLLPPQLRNLGLPVVQPEQGPCRFLEPLRPQDAAGHAQLPHVAAVDAVHHRRQHVLRKGRVAARHAGHKRARRLVVAGRRVAPGRLARRHHARLRLFRLGCRGQQVRKGARQEAPEQRLLQHPRGAPDDPPAEGFPVRQLLGQGHGPALSAVPGLRPLRPQVAQRHVHEVVRVVDVLRGLPLADAQLVVQAQLVDEFQQQEIVIAGALLRRHHARAGLEDVCPFVLARVVFLFVVRRIR
ncbi:hypothetical protein SPBR_01408 [Sporothrix brasiliensis 5110]|uniref:Uncharacterized protein n=1 Tax=Sporothrix brasiliensis 5110 TaxID=1398154 RepID=A0A0C2J3X3_9PEZI|nr:uncharacterized protein SPBR_01408 [Sporothrix brasiliensis 5110]KIH91777.1 hypothetical protein SPBR_01408 [Sporothrix brasiliensis 5110]